MLLVPGDLLHPGQPDEHFAPEAEAARKAGIGVVLVDDTDLPAKAALRVLGETGGRLLYRGWMLSAEQYELLQAAASARGVDLAVNAAQYRRAHHLPGWYEAFKHLTPASVWTDGADVEAALAAARSLLPGGGAVVKDYVKSVKHLWNEACYIPELADEGHARSVLERFLQERDPFQGGLVLRAYEAFEGPEARSWWREGRPVLVTAHPDTPDECPDDVPVDDAADAVARLEHPFVTVDWARRTDGTWRVIEVGDGQVSDRPVTTPAEQLIAALFEPSH